MIRQFKIGDLVVSKEHGIGTINISDGDWIQINYPSWFTDINYHSSTDDIKTIRTPRKGSKDARDIVAMLLSNARDAKKRYNTAFNKDLKSIYAVSHDISMRLYEQAKELLK